MRRAGLAILLALAAWPAAAQNVEVRAFDDRNGNGIQDAGEPALEGVELRLFGNAGALDETSVTGVDGSATFSPGNGCYVLTSTDPPGWRMSQPREDGFVPSSPGYDFPVGQPRFSKLDHVVTNLQAGGYTYASIGDSIAWNFNLCGYPESFWYSKQVRDRLQCAKGGSAIALNQAAIKGEHTDDLLVDEGGETNNVFRLLDLAPDLITISMIGNDLLDVDPGGNPSQAEVNRAVAEVLDARQNLQEVISTLLAELPNTDIALNTLYDNEAYNCYSGNPSVFHRTWIPIVSRMLRDLAWGQSRRVATNEVAADFAHEDQAADCTGYDGMICRDFFLFDTIHPTNNGFSIVREKVWEGVGGVSLGAGDALGRTSQTVDHGYLRRVRRLRPTSFETLGGATVAAAPAAFSGDDGGAAASITLGAAAEEFRVAGFPDWFDEIEIERVVAGVRYRTTGLVTDDFYRMEVSVNDTFRAPPGFAYTPTAWAFYTPIVGGGGPNRPPENPDYADARVLAIPNKPMYHEVSALIRKNPALPPGASDYVWPAVTHEELATTTLRVAAAPVAGTVGNDDYTIELDEAWLDLYGWEKPRPGEVEELRLDLQEDGTIELAFDVLPDAARYNLYVGRIANVRSGQYDHGTTAPSPAVCATLTQPAAAGRLETLRRPSEQVPEDVYFLVTGHVDDVESPAGFASGGGEIDRSQSVCR